MLNVYIFTCNKQYGGGMAVVTAPDSGEAMLVLQQYFGGDDYVFEYTDLEHCRATTQLSTTLDEPQVIECNFYVE